MNLWIDNKSGEASYAQIVRQIRDQIINGSLTPEQPLPSIRNLARDLRISVITTKRAYDELEQEGLIYTLPSKGCFVASRNTEWIREENLKKIEGHIQEIVRLSASCNLRKNDVAEMLDLIWNESQE